jgi:protein-S-isoprenylcysteine O-methyltransferase Ste14
MLLNYRLLAGRTDLIEERLRPGKGMKRWDRLYFFVNTPLYFLILVLAALDAGRFGWSPRLPAGVYVAAYLLYALGQGIFLWAKRQNRYFSTVVRIQKDRGQSVCQEGPYRFVRHPGYVGGLVFTLVTPLLLGSLWALIPAVLSDAALVIRTGLEDATLRRELPGYQDYSRQVRYRLVPKLW